MKILLTGEGEGLKEHIRAIETVDKMTDRQISTKVRERFFLTKSL